MAVKLDPNDAARRCAAAAGPPFTAELNAVTTPFIHAEIPRNKNPGADDTEWIFTVQLEGTPESVGKLLKVLHASLEPAERTFAR